MVGLEPTLPREYDFESHASTVPPHRRTGGIQRKGRLSGARDCASGFERSPTIPPTRRAKSGRRHFESTGPVNPSRAINSQRCERIASHDRRQPAYIASHAVSQCIPANPQLCESANDSRQPNPPFIFATLRPVRSQPTWWNPSEFSRKRNTFSRTRTRS